MKLKEYLLKNYLDKREFSKLSGISESTIYRILSGRSCSLKNAKLIDKYTKGQVTSKDIYSFDEE